MKSKTRTRLNALIAGCVIFFISVLSFSVIAGTSPDSFYNSSIKLNPACKIKRMSSGTVIVLAKNNEGQEVRHEFNDFYADLLMAAYRKQRVEFILNSFAKKYYLSEEDCRRELKHAINVLADWNIVLRDESMTVR